MKSMRSFAGYFYLVLVFLAHSMNELGPNAMARRPSSVRPSVCPSVNFCANRFFSQTNGRIATKLVKMDSRSACIQDVLKVKVKVKGHVIRALF